MPPGDGRSEAVPAPPDATTSSVGGPAIEENRAGEVGSCRHCGQGLLGSVHRNEAGESFCCRGCREVHAWLGDQGMDRYYDLLSQSGRRAPSAWADGSYREFLKALRDPAVLAGLGRWDGKRHEITLESRDVVCAACGYLIERLLGARDGVSGFEVDFLHGEIHLAYDAEQVSLADLLEEISRFGYRFRPKPVDAPTGPKADAALLSRLAVSGACFANAMAFALANYLGAFQGIDPRWMAAFGWLGLLVAVPAVAYSAFPFYAGAYESLKRRRFSIDITLTLGIAIAFTVTLVGTVTGRLGNFSDSLTGLVFLLLAGRWALRRFESGLALQGRWFEALRREAVAVRRDGRWTSVSPEAVRSGETLRVEAGQSLPLDGVLSSPVAWLDTSLLTGESRPRRLVAGQPVFAGTLNLREPMEMVATGICGATRVAHLAEDLRRLTADRRPVPDSMAAVAAGFTAVVLVAGFFALAWHWPQGAWEAANAAASVFIISCSCALALTGPITRGLGLKRALGLGFHFKSQHTLEALADVRAVLFDKTGTLTFTQRSVAAWHWLPDARAHDPDWKEETFAALRALVSHSLHPASQSLARSLEGGRRGRDPDLIGVREIPHFGLIAQRKEPGFWSSLCLCRRGAWDEKDGTFHGLGIPRPSTESWPEGDTVLFLDGKAIALIRFEDEIKPDIPLLIRGLEAAGRHPMLLSGDQPSKVMAFGRRCGFSEARGGLTPEEKRDTVAEIRRRLDSPENPSERFAGKKRRQAGPARILAVGDGFNDSLLFGAADLALAVQGGAVDKTAATDILAMMDRPLDLLRLFEVARGVRRARYACYAVSGAYNVFAIGAAMAGLVTPLFAAVLMPVSSLSLVAAAWAAIPRR